MNKNIIIIILSIAVLLSVIAITLAIVSVNMHHNMMTSNMGMNGMYSPMNQNYMENNYRGDHSMMKHSVESELEFIVEMIPHHQEAVDSSKQLLELGTDNQNLEQLLNEIITAQEREISMMQGWLEEWYANENYESNYIEMMQDLSQFDESQRDEVYIMGMIMHHQMAIIMAQSVLDIEDIRDEVRELANEIIIAQEEEIKILKSLL